MTEQELVKKLNDNTEWEWEISFYGVRANFWIKRYEYWVTYNLETGFMEIKKQSFWNRDKYRHYYSVEDFIKKMEERRVPWT